MINKSSIINNLKEIFNKKTGFYNISYFKSDLLSAISVALLALPQSLAYALIAGLPPLCGVLAAIFGSIFTSTFGHSRHLISGPTNATAFMMQVGVSQILYTHFPDVSADIKATIALQIISQIVFFIGMIQILIGVLKLGDLTQFISRSVMMGYVCGVALTLFITQIFNILAIPSPNGVCSLFHQGLYLITHISSFNLSVAIFGFLCFSLLLTLRILNKKLPNAIITIILSALVMMTLNHFSPFLNTTAFKTLSTPQVNIKSLFDFHLIYFESSILRDLLFLSFATSLLSIFEVNSITRLISAKSSQNINSNRDIRAVGISNLFSSFFLGILPSSGSPSRSIFNFNNGGRSRLSGVLSGFFLLGLLVIFKPLIQFIPVCALAALLLILAYEIIDFKLLKICFRATKRDAMVLIVTSLSCLFLQLDIALFIGIALSLVLYLRLAADPSLLEYVVTKEGKLRPYKKEHGRSDDRVRIINMEGGLFFGSVDSLQKQMNHICKNKDVQIIILRLYDVRHLDASICYFLEVLALNLKKEGKQLYLSEILKPTAQVIYCSTLLNQMSKDYLFESHSSSPHFATKEAFKQALKNLETNNFCK